MSLAPRIRLINPRLGTYFSIFASIVVGLTLMVMILEQLGASSALLSAAMLFVPVGL